MQWIKSGNWVIKENRKKRRKQRKEKMLYANIWKRKTNKEMQRGKKNWWEGKLNKTKDNMIIFWKKLIKEEKNNDRKWKTK